MGKIPGINHLHVVRALEKAGLVVARHGKHIIMTEGKRVLVAPRNNPVNAYTLAAIVRSAGLTAEEFLQRL